MGESSSSVSNSESEKRSESSNYVESSRRLIKELLNRNTSIPPELVQAQDLLEQLEANAKQIATNIHLARENSNKKSTQEQLTFNNEGLLREQDLHLNKIAELYSSISEHNWYKS